MDIKYQRDLLLKKKIKLSFCFNATFNKTNLNQLKINILFKTQERKTRIS